MKQQPTTLTTETVLTKKILIVRGDRQNAKSLSFLLAGSGYQIFSIASAGEAIEAARHQRFDLAITDESLPENNPELTLVANLKEAQPSLPIFYLAAEQSLEKIIACIRAGVTEVINDPTDLKTVIETTNSFLRGPGHSSNQEEVSWEDILEVERMLEATVGHATPGGDETPRASSAEVQALKEKLESTLADRDKIAGELASSLASLEKNRTLVEELKHESGNKATDSEMEERALRLDERELKLKEMSNKLSQQKFEVESQLAELEAQQVEFEEAQKDAGLNSSGVGPSNAELDQERATANEARLELEATIQDLQRELAIAKGEAGNSEQIGAELASLREKLQDSTELLAEKEFIIEQRDRELQDLKAQAETTASNPQLEELEESKRLVEIERHKLRERIDQLELEKRLSDEKHQKDQREIQVERRDAEISLRELQNTIKEEQLKLKVGQASLHEEIRQFEQARTNFQEDIQELQSKQAELRKMEAYLNQMEQSIKANGLMAENALPKPDSSALDPIESSSMQFSAQANSLESNEKSKPAEGTSPEKWGKPDMDKKAGRGPLRIGRRSSF